MDSNRRLPALLALSVLVTPLTFGDDSAMLGLSGAPKPMKGHPTIRMVSEVVRCEIPSGKVRAVFTFRNEGPATTVRMGFPEQGWANALPGSGSNMGNFRTYVDGKRVAVKRMQATGVEKPDENNEYSAWWVKTVAFRAGQTRIVIDEYEGGMGWNTSNEESFQYILTTGANWRGPIGSVRVFVDKSRLGHVARFTTHQEDGLTGGVSKGNIIKWYFRNLDPKTDIWLQWYQGFDRFAVNGHILDIDERRRFVQGIPPAQLRGNDVWLPAALAAKLIGAHISEVRKGRSLKMSLGGRSALLRVAPPNVAWEREYGIFRVSLAFCVKALGGAVAYDRKDDLVRVTISH